MKTNRNYIDLLWQFWNQWLKYKNVDPIVSFARTLLGLGVALLAPGGIWWCLTLTISPETIPAAISFTINPATVTISGFILLFSGLFLGLFGVYRAHKKRSAFLIYLQGMPGMDHQAPEKDLPPQYRYGCVSSYCIETASKPTETFLEDIKILDSTVSRKIISNETDAPVIFFAGLAPVPQLYVAGATLLSRCNLKVLDYNRFEKKWHMLDGVDDGQGIKIMHPDGLIEKNLGIAMSFSVDINLAQIPTELKDKTITVTLDNAEVATDSLNSEQKLKRVLAELHDLIRGLRNMDGYESVEKIHLFIAAQASTVFSLGTLYQTNIYPEIEIYQYQGSKGKYTSSILLKDGRPQLRN